MGFLTGVYNGDNAVYIDSAGNLQNVVTVLGVNMDRDMDWETTGFNGSLHTSINPSLGTYTINSLKISGGRLSIAAGTKLEITSGSIIINGSGWMSAVSSNYGSVTSGLWNADKGTYDLYVTNFSVSTPTGTLHWNHIQTGLADNDSGKMSFIYSGGPNSLPLTLSAQPKTYTGDTIVTSGTLIVAHEGNASPQYEVADGAILRLGGRTPRTYTTIDNEPGNISVITGGVLGTGTVYLGHGRSTDTNQGSVTLDGTNFTHDGSTLTEVTMQGPNVTLTGDTILQATTVTLGNPNVGTMPVNQIGQYGGYGTTTLTGDAYLKAGTLQKAGNLSSLFNFIGGTLTVDNVTFALDQNGGILAPGGIGFAGTTSITGDYSITAGTIQMEIFSDILWDTLFASDNITLAPGVLDVLLLCDSLTEGDTFQLFTTTDNMFPWESDMLSAASREYWDVTRNPGEIIYRGGLTPSGGDDVPEPATWALMLLGGAAMVGMRLRRRK